jgi:6-pyruvoyl-tetrahydropterin synthase
MISRFKKKSSKKEIVDQFDHNCFNETTPHVELAELINRGHHVILVDYQPTSENMVVDFSTKNYYQVARRDQTYRETDSSL